MMISVQSTWPVLVTARYMAIWHTDHNDIAQHCLWMRSAPGVARGLCWPNVIRPGVARVLCWPNSRYFYFIRWNLEGSPSQSYYKICLAVRSPESVSLVCVSYAKFLKVGVGGGGGVQPLKNNLSQSVLCFIGEIFERGLQPLENIFFQLLGLEGVGA